jgi:hypothetical protein
MQTNQPAPSTLHPSTRPNQIRLSDDDDLVAKAKDLHPQLLGGAFIFFALGASGGILSLVMQDKPILSSPHSTTAFIGLGLLALQAMLPRESACGLVLTVCAWA